MNPACLSVSFMKPKAVASEECEMSFETVLPELRH